MTNHDRLVKELLTEFFAEFIDLFLPRMGEYLDRGSLAFLDKEIFTDITAGESHEADLIVKARFQGQESFFLVHVEHQAQTQPHFDRRMFRYFSRLYEKHGLPVYPIALFSHESTRPEPEVHQVTFPDLDVLAFRYRVIQLSRLNWREYVRRPNPVASALMARMQMAEEERPRVKLECLRLLATLKLNPARMRLISGFVDTYLRLTAQEILIFRRELDTLLPPTEKANVMELTTSWKEEGRLEGRQEGRLEGRLEAGRQLVARQLHRRIGHVNPILISRLQALTTEQVECLGEDLLDFKTAEDLEGWFQKHDG